MSIVEPHTHAAPKVLRGDAVKEAAEHYEMPEERILEVPSQNFACPCVGAWVRAYVRACVRA